MTARLPPRPDLDWGANSAPRDRAADDIYFSPEDGLSEARAVFLTGCGLPEAWIGREAFTVGELGFGTGLNFLALWELWRRHRRAPSAWLHFVSVERQPFDAPDAARALQAWPELTDLAAQLIARWPDRAKGVRRMSWPEEGVSLTLHIDDADAALANMELRADAWFLDGYAPAKNPAMWSPGLLARLAERSRPGARAATFTVAGAVRRGLETAGFEAVKRPGHGRKRERLEAKLTAAPPPAPDLYGLRPAARPPRRVAVLGAGIAGACAARAVLDRGAEAVVFDPAVHPGAGASGNLLALVAPRLDAADTVQARLLIDAYLHARAAYAGLPGAEPCEALRHAEDEAAAERFAKVLADPPLGLEDLEAVRGGGMMHKRAMLVRPASLLPALLAGAELRLGGTPNVDLAARRVDGETFDAVIVANGMAAASFPELDWLPLEGRLGQVETVSGAARTAASAVEGDGYALTSGGDRLVGASFEAADGPPETSAAVRAANLARLPALSPWMRNDFERFEAVSRAAVRATTPDRLPLAGAAPDRDAFLETFAPLRTGGAAAADAPLLDGVYLATGFGARGFTWGPWAASVVAAQVFGDPPPASQSALQATAPARLLVRDLRRRRV